MRIGRRADQLVQLNLQFIESSLAGFDLGGKLDDSIDTGFVTFGHEDLLGHPYDDRVRIYANFKKRNMVIQMAPTMYQTNGLTTSTS